MRPFFILGLPRSRTAWLANFLTYGPAFCYHEGLIGCGSTDDYARKLCAMDKPFVGDSNSGAVFFIDDIMRLFPESRLVIIERNVDDCKASMSDIGFPSDKIIDDTLAALDYTKSVYSPLIIPFDDLTKDGCEVIWDYCIGQGKDEMFRQRLDMLDGLNIAIIVGKKFAHIQENMHHFEELLRNHPCQCLE